MKNMKKLSDLIENPSGFDSLANYVGDIPESDWLVVMTRNRDSDILTESNWECALEELGAESDKVEVFRFGHWACGWWEALAVRKETKAAEIGQDIVNRLDSYPILNEDDFCKREMQEADRVWKDCYSYRERVEYIREHRTQFEFHDFSDLRAVVRGEYFNGYASELI